MFHRILNFLMLQEEMQSEVEGRKLPTSGNAQSHQSFFPNLLPEEEI
jgi:hypothetical protein|tara:strand:- start:675 stop:815 length:141 start_codon:yes stop_codon:yes gene_type:complete